MSSVLELFLTSLQYLSQEFDRGESEASHKPIEGQLLKWTNVVKGG